MSNAASLNIAAVLVVLFLIGVFLVFRWAEKTPFKDPRKKLPEDSD